MSSPIHVHRYDEQVSSLGAMIDSHHAQGVAVALATVEEREAIAECRRRIEAAEKMQVGESIRALNFALDALESPNPDYDKVRVLLSEISAPVEEPCEGGLASATSLVTADSLLEELLAPEELLALQGHLRRPLYERLRWAKGDYVAAGAAVVLGLTVELLNLAWRANSPIDAEGRVRHWFDQKLHHHAPDNPIDYQGKGFGGEFHRARSRGHDLSRFLEAVAQTAKGEYRGVRWEYRTPREVISRLNQFGKAYPTMSWLAAFVNVAVHLFADFFSAHSLPLPLSSVVYENCGRDMRKFVVTLYEEGFNLRHVGLGALELWLANVAVDVWLWLQVGSDHTKDEPVILKRYEMRTAVTAMLSGVNIGGCALFKDPFLINIPMLIETVDSAVRLTSLNSERRLWTRVEGRNLEALVAEWEALAAAVRS